MADEDYLLDNRAAVTGGRFGALSDVFDQVTFRHLDAPADRPRLAVLRSDQ